MTVVQFCVRIDEFSYMMTREGKLHNWTLTNTERFTADYIAQCELVNRATSAFTDICSCLKKVVFRFWCSNRSFRYFTNNCSSFEKH